MAFASYLMISLHYSIKRFLVFKSAVEECLKRIAFGIEDRFAVVNQFRQPSVITDNVPIVEDSAFRAGWQCVGDRLSPLLGARALLFDDQDEPHRDLWDRGFGCGYRSGNRRGRWSRRR